MITIQPGPRRGRVVAPPSKSHEHRLLIADFLAGDMRRIGAAPTDSEDVRATKRCLLALSSDDDMPLLDCGESGSTRRFLAPVAAALGKRPVWKTAGRLSSRPQMDYDEIKPGAFELEGNISSQFVTGLLFALPLLGGDSRIRFKTPLESVGYVDLTLRVLEGAGIRVDRVDDGFDVPGRQKYASQHDTLPEGDWSGAAFWYAMNAIGSDVRIDGLDFRSLQPDSVIREFLGRMEAAYSTETVTIDVSGSPDIFPVLTVVAAAREGDTLFTGTKRLRLKESDRVAAMADVLGRFGAKTDASEGEFAVHGKRGSFSGGSFESFGDHRIAMSIAVGATNADSAVTIDDETCAAKSYPGFFDDFMSRLTVFSRI